MSEIKVSTGDEGPSAGQVVLHIVASLAIAGLFAFLIYMVAANWLQIGALQEKSERAQDGIRKNQTKISELNRRLEELLAKTAEAEGSGDAPRLEASHGSFSFVDDNVREWWANEADQDVWGPRQWDGTMPRQVGEHERR
jgi:hypothetical protein